MSSALKRICKTLDDWWQGEFIPLPPNDPNSSFIIFSLGDYCRHWTSRFAHVVVDFYLKEWRWLLPFAVAVTGAVVAIKKL
jgi:hypothetical protein